MPAVVIAIYKGVVDRPLGEDVLASKDKLHLNSLRYFFELRLISQAAEIRPTGSVLDCHPHKSTVLVEI